MPNYNFPLTSISENVRGLRKQWLASLTSPQDGMWASFRDAATFYELRQEQTLMGYACVDAEQRLLQFFLSPAYLPIGEEVFGYFLEERKIKRCIVGTNNPHYLTCAIPHLKELSVHTYLFRQHLDVTVPKKAGTLRLVQDVDVSSIVDFCHYSLGAPRDWLQGYIGDLASKGAVYVLKKEEHVIGTCEVRKSSSNPQFADIGMIVSPDFLRQGYGTYLLDRAKRLATSQELIPICSCEKENTGSFKAITKGGFVSTHQLLALSFS